MKSSGSPARAARRGCADTGLELDKDGFINVTDTLQTVTDPNMFAAGDIASMVNCKLEKAGVFAVRQGPPLTRESASRGRRCAARDLSPAAPLARADQHRRQIRRGVARLVGFAGERVWQWKDWIDRRFMTQVSGPHADGSESRGPRDIAPATA